MVSPPIPSALRSCPGSLTPVRGDSHYLAIPPGAHLLSDMILSSPILAGDRGIPEEAMGDAGAPGAGADAFEFGVDPSLDPELAMVCLTILELRRVEPLMRRVSV